MLNPQTFATELDKFGNPDSADFVAGPTDEADAADKHADAFRLFMSDLVTVPTLPAAIHDAAREAMRAVLIGQALPPPASLGVINGAYTAYVSVLLAALAAQSWIVATPPVPPGPLLVPLPPGAGTLAYAAQVYLWLIAISGSVLPTPPAPWQ